MKRACLIWFMGLLLISLSGVTVAGDVSATKHNLSASGPGTIKATAEQKVCIFCHTPHLASPDTPLWNHALPAGQTYNPYVSSTLIAAPGQPTGASKLCLSCHDGTIALGSVLNMPGRNRWEGHAVGEESGVIVGLEAAMPGTSTALLGTDLRDDHPVSFIYNDTLAIENGELVLPSELSDSIKPDKLGYLQCTSCHDPHTDVNPMFLRLASTDGAGYGAQLCRTCHTKEYWGTVTDQPHRESLAEWNGAGTNPWFQDGHNLANDGNSTPKANACFSCHQPHNGGGGTKLLARDGEQEVCLACHNGNVATKDIEASVNKFYAHPMLVTDGVHDAQRDGVSGKVRETQANLDNRHAECQDCHNPHAVSAGVSPGPTDTGGTSNLASNVLRGAWGVEPSWPGNWGMLNDTDYAEVDDVVYQYQLCMKCHSSYAFGFSPPPEPENTPGYDSMTDQAMEFNPNNASYHPVAAAGKNDFSMNVTGEGVFDYSSSLLGNLSASSTMSCTNCHSDPDADIGGPKGPHGSDFWPILKAAWGAETGTTGSASHLCFECHDVNVYTYTSTYTNWQNTGYSGMCTVFCEPDIRLNLHAWHGFVLGGLPCMTCHTAVPHGSDKRALLKYGQDPLFDSGADPEPYNAQERRKVVGVGGTTGWSNFGIPSRATVDTIQSGNWVKTDCHGTGDQGSATAGVGCTWIGD
ncbi:MAG: hypothetical protein L3J28_02150 [Candidatus Polarisedimenticolaceae bacterium]|nr:hypothetical protein [Candidatus Polarisedimenticolaceae bacterium]